MNERVFDGRIAGEIAPDDRARQERLKATARALVSAVRDGLVRDGAVRLHGFGTFRLRPVAARKGRHPRTGEPIDIPAGWRVMFRPAKALRERVEPDQSPSLPIGEPHASREAMLAASAAAAARDIRPGAGRIPADGIAAPMPAEPGRAAAAAISEPKRTLAGPIPPASVDLEADSRVTRSPAALTRAPAANEPPPEPSATEPSAAEPAPATATGRRHDYRYALLLLVVLLLAGLAWLLRPVDSPAPPVAEEPDPSVTGGLSGDAGNASPDAAATADGIASGEPETAMALTEPPPGQAGTGENVATVDETVEVASSATADRDVPASPEDPSAPDTGEAGGAGMESTTGQTARVSGSARADESAPAVGPDAGSPDEVMAALSRAAEASAAPPSDTATAGDVHGEAAMVSSAEPDVARVDNTASVGTEPAGDALDQRQEVEVPAAGARVTDDAAAEGAPWFSGRDYTVRSGDTLWELADRHYVNPYYWPHIWNHNSGIANPDHLEVRQGLWLPSLEGDPQSLTAADRRSIAEGYLRLYRFFRAQGDANPQYALVGVRYFDVSVLPERLRGTAAGHPGDTLAAAFRARLEAEFPLD